jgi:asparagine synthase (glutamine-hydrolysing)
LIVLHFIGVVSFGAPLPASANMEQAARRLGGPDFGAVKSWRGPGCVLAWRLLPLRAETAVAPVPVLSRDGALAAIGCGRIDARAHLIAALDLPARTWTDTELMMASFSRWGEAGADRLMGNFGFAVWDALARRLTLARDHLGSMPMFYHVGDGFAAFGTNPAALLALGLFSRELDLAMVGENILGRSLNPEATLYAELRRVRRGATCVIDPSGARQSVYWRPRRGAVLKLKDDQAYVEAARAILAEVTRGHLRAQKPIGVMLSGGFDSGGVAATLAMLAPEREIFGFTTTPVPGDPSLARGMAREREHVERLAARYPNLRVEFVSEKTLGPIDEDFRDFFADTGLPLTGTSLATRRIALAEAARARGVGTLLNGDGGNGALTAVGADVYRELFLSGRWVRLAHEIWAGARFRGKPAAQVIWSEAIYDILPRGAVRAWRALRGRKPQLITDGTFLRPEFALQTGLAAQWSASWIQTDALRLRHKREFLPAMLNLQPSHFDAYTLAYHRLGMECHSPLRDRRLVDFALSLPATQFQRGGVNRFLGRRVLADRLPSETLAERQLFPSFADQEHWLAGWWEEAGRKLEEQKPADLAAAALDLPALRALLSKPLPDPFPETDPEQYRIGSRLPNSLHINQFLRWHQGMND